MFIDVKAIIIIIPDREICWNCGCVSKPALQAKEFFQD
jgi:hypothetical protein